MDGGQLHRLGKRLIELSSQVTSEDSDLSLTRGEAIVLEYVIKHPACSMSAIHRRTGRSQSHVSESVSRLKARGLVEVAPDPSDGRRTQIRIVDGALQAITRRSARGIDQAIGYATSDPAQARRATDLLEELADLLL